MPVAGLKSSPTCQSPLLHPSPVQTVTKPAPPTHPSLSRGAFWGDELPRGEYSLALGKTPMCWLTHLYPGWFPYGKPCSFMGFAWTQHFPAPTFQINETLFNTGNNMFRIFSQKQLLYCNLGAFEATTNRIRELEVYSLCKAQLAVVYDEVHRKSGENLDGSSNTDVLKMKACSSMKCLNKVFWY